MRPREVLREAGRNVASGTARVALLAMTVLLAIGGIVAADARALTQAQHHVQDWRAAGGGVWVLNAEGAVDAAACERLARVDGVVAAGAARKAGSDVAVAQLGGRTAPTYEVSPGLLAVLGLRGAGTAPHAGVVLGPSLAETVGRGTGAQLDLDGRTTAVLGVLELPDDGRVTPFQYAALVAVPPAGAFDTCWSAVWPPDEDVASLVQSVVVAGTPEDTRSELTVLNPTIARSIDPAELYGARPTALAPVGVGLVGVLLGFGAVRARRLEIASALHAGVPRTALTGQLLLEALCWAGTGAAWALAAAVAISRAGAAIDPGPVDAHTATLLALGVAATALGTVAGAAVTREDHLLTYFKTR